MDATSFPVKSEYSLTESGLGIADVIGGIRAWALRWKMENLPCSGQDCRVCVL